MSDICYASSFIGSVLYALSFRSEFFDFFRQRGCLGREILNFGRQSSTLRTEAIRYRSISGSKTAMTYIDLVLLGLCGEFLTQDIDLSGL